MYFAKSTNSFYDQTITPDVPKDAIRLTQDQYKNLMNEARLGKVIDVDAQGNVVAVNPPPPSPEQQRELTNNAARAYLNSTDWYVTRNTETGEAIPAEITAARAQARASIVE